MDARALAALERYGLDSEEWTHHLDTSASGVVYDERLKMFFKWYFERCSKLNIPCIYMSDHFYESSFEWEHIRQEFDVSAYYCPS